MPLFRRLPLALAFVPLLAVAQSGSVSFTAGLAAYGVEGYDCDPTLPTVQIGSGDIRPCFYSFEERLDPAPSKRGAGSGGFAAIRIRADITDRVAGELAVHTHWDTNADGRGLPIRSEGEFEHTWAAGIDFGAEYALVEGPVRPTVTAGIGVITFNRDGTLLFRETIRPAVFAGAGLEYALNRWALVRVDGRLRQAFTDGRTLARGAEVSGGIGFAF